MVIKAILFLCAQALMIQTITGSCIGSRFAGPLYDIGYSAPYAGSLAAPCAASGLLAADVYGYAVGPAALGASNGGGLPTSSASPIPASGVSLLSENVYEGRLEAIGALPFLGTAVVEGVLPTAGAGAVAYSSGNGNVGMLSENIGAVGMAGPYGVGLYGNGLYGDGVIGDGLIGDGLYGAGAFGYGIGLSGYGAPLAGRYGLAGYGCGGLI